MSSPSPVLFPTFKPLELSDRETIHEWFWEYQPQTSELTFTNLFMWRFYYNIEWSVYNDWLILLCSPADRDSFFLPPIGPAPRNEAVRTALVWLKQEKKIRQPYIERADKKLVLETKDLEGLNIQEIRDHFDYVYQTDDLIQLSGRKFHNKKNQINRFVRMYGFEYVPFSNPWVEECLIVLEKWCDQRECEKYPVLKAETSAVKQAIKYFEYLQIQGGAVLIHGKVEAFTLGEMLNRDTAVIHVEKTDPGIRGLFAVINQQFCEKEWAGVPFVNREQDLGVSGLRKAKLSYNPIRLVEKYRITLQ